MSWPADMTLDHASFLRSCEPIGCACIGPHPDAPPGSPCRCAVGWAQVEALHRGAHIVARLLADAASRPAP